MTQNSRSGLHCWGTKDNETASNMNYHMDRIGLTNMKPNIAAASHVFLTITNLTTIGHAVKHKWLGDDIDTLKTNYINGVVVMKMHSQKLVVVTGTSWQLHCNCTFKLVLHELHNKQLCWGFDVNVCYWVALNAQSLFNWLLCKRKNKIRQALSEPSDNNFMQNGND